MIRSRSKSAIIIVSSSVALPLCEFTYMCLEEVDVLWQRIAREPDNQRGTTLLA